MPAKYLIYNAENAVDTYVAKYYVLNRQFNMS